MTLLFNMARAAINKATGKVVEEVPASLAAEPQEVPTFMSKMKDAVSRATAASTPSLEPDVIEQPDTPEIPLKIKLPEDHNISTAIDQAASKIGIDRGYMYAMAAQESSFRPAVKATTSSATGLYQFLDATWNDVVKKYGKQYPELSKGRTDPLAAAIGAALYTKDNTRVLERANIPVNPTTMYATHFLGPGGARTLYRAKDTAMASDVMPDAAASNPAVFKGKTVAQVKQFLESKVGARATKYNNFFSTSSKPE